MFVSFLYLTLNNRWCWLASQLTLALSLNIFLPNIAIAESNITVWGQFEDRNQVPLKNIDCMMLLMALVLMLFYYVINVYIYKC